MSYRFTNTDKWTDKWYLELSPQSDKYSSIFEDIPEATVVPDQLAKQPKKERENPQQGPLDNQTK
jgi:hypothetical protein